MQLVVQHGCPIEMLLRLYRLSGFLLSDIS